MPGASAADAGRAENARGTAYELHAIQEDARDTLRAEPGRHTWFSDRIPPYLVQFVRGEPLTIRGFHETLRWLREREAERVRLGRSPQFGMDGVSAIYVALIRRRLDEMLVKILEVKSSKNAIGCAEIGANLSLMVRCMRAYKDFPKRIPTLRLLATHKPTPEVYETFKGDEKRFEFRQVAMPRELERPESWVEFELRHWQQTAVRRTLKHLRPRARVQEDQANVTALWDAACGCGKTHAALAFLQQADWAKVKIFVANTPTMAAQVKEEAKALKIEPVVLTCHTSSSRAVDFEADEADEEDEDEANYADDDDGQCSVIRRRLAHLVARATKAEPAFVIICHYTLGVLTSTVGRASGPEPKGGKYPQAWGARQSVWDGMLLGLPRDQHVLVVVDEWHKIRRRRHIFKGLFADAHRCRSVLMTGTIPAPATYAEWVRPRIARILENAKVTGKQNMWDGILLGYLVPGHAETAFATDAEKQERSSAGTTLEEKVQTAANWMVFNAVHSAAIYCGGIQEANAIAEAMGPALRAASGEGTAWAAAVHSRKTVNANRRTLETLKAPTHVGGHDYRVVVSVAMLEEGFNYPALDACILFAVPANPVRLMQVIQRCMRASPGKTLGRILLFGDANDAGSVGRLLHKYDPDHRAISVGATPLTLQGHLDAWSNAGGARDQCDAKATQFKEAIKATIVACATRDERVEAIAKGFLKFAWAEIKAKGPTARGTSYARYFKRNDNKKFKYRLKGVTFERKANEHFSQVRHDFHTEGATNWFHTEELRNLHRALPIWNGDPPPPSERKPRKAPMTALRRMDEMHAIYERTGRLPRQNSKDPEEAA